MDFDESADLEIVLILRFELQFPVVTVRLLLLYQTLTDPLRPLSSGMDGSNDVALYSGLGAGIIAVAALVVAVMLYRKNHSEYGVDVIDSSALAGGFQSFNFKTNRQGEAKLLLPQQHTSNCCEAKHRRGDGWH